MMIGAMALSIGLGLGAGTLAWSLPATTGEAADSNSEGVTRNIAALAHAAEKTMRKTEVGHASPRHTPVVPAAPKADMAAISARTSSSGALCEKSHATDEGESAASPSVSSPKPASEPEANRPSEAQTTGGTSSQHAQENSEEAAAETEAGTEPTSEVLAPRTLVIAGSTVPYCDVRGGTTPSSGGGLWLGSDDVDDNSWGYFVGHNPGSFAPVHALREGSPVTVCDHAGNQRTYTVRERFSVDASATWRTIASRVTGCGESVVLQTCNDDGITNTIVVAVA